MSTITSAVRKYCGDSQKLTFYHHIKPGTQELEVHLNGVFDDVYTALNKRLVINPYVTHIDFAPRPNAGLIFTLPTSVKFINEKFWQPGNSYFLNAFFDETTLDYLKSIRDQHGIEIRYDGCGFWNISKREPSTGESFNIKRVHVYQMN